MKLTLSELKVSTSRYFSLEEPVAVEAGGDKYLATMFVAISHTYEYGATENEYQIRGQLLKTDGTPDERKGPEWVRLFGPTHELLPDPRQPFLEALANAMDGR